MAKITLTKDPSHNGYYQDQDGNLYVFRFGGRPIRVDDYREDKPSEKFNNEKVEVEQSEVVDHRKSASYEENKKFIDLAEEEFEKREKEIKKMKPSDKNYDTERNHLESQQRDLVEEINKTEDRKFKQGTLDYETLHEKVQDLEAKTAQKNVYKKYDNDLGEVDDVAFKNDNPDIVLKEANRSTEAWTTDDGSYESNSMISKYMRNKAEGNSNMNNRMEKAVKDLDDQMRETSNNFTMYRTTQVPLSKIQIGDVIDKDTFIDGSISKEYSLLHFNYGDAYSTTVEVEVPAKTRALYIGDKTSYKQNEYEVLLGKGYGIKITEMEKQYDKDGDYMNTIVKGKVIPYKSSKSENVITIDKNSNDFRTIQEILNNLFK